MGSLTRLIIALAICVTIVGSTHYIQYSKGKDRPGKVANPACGQLNREKDFFPVPVRIYLRIWSRETGSAVPSRVSLLISILRLNWCLLTGFLPSSAVAGDGRNMSPFPEEVSSKEPLPRKHFNKLLLE